MRLADSHILEMNETLTNFRNAVAESTDLQEKVKAGADLVALVIRSPFLDHFEC